VNPNATIGPPPPQPSTLLAVTIAAASSQSTTVYGQSVTFAVTVTPAAGAGAPSGQVICQVDGQATHDSPLTLNANGKATFAAISSLSVGNHTIAIGYLGDGTFTPGTETLAQTVKQATSAVAIASSVNPSAPNAAVAFTVTVTAVPPGEGTPTGAVTLQIDGQPTADSPLTLNAAGEATAAALNTLTAGSHTVTSNYPGDANFAAGAGTLTQSVRQRSGRGG
jgi:Bacterial Ig-like domain (group 3)